MFLGGASGAAIRTAAKYADVHLMWGEPVERMADRAAEAKKRAAEPGRTIEVGTRFQVVCRETDEESRAATEDIVGHIDERHGDELRSHADRTDSAGHSRQNELWQASGGDWLTDVLRNGFARARLGRRWRWSAPARRSSGRSTSTSRPASTGSSSPATATTRRRSGSGATSCRW